MIETIGAAIILGLAGSLHCIGMCGPLVSALQSIAKPGAWRIQQWLYHLGRWSVYALLGTIAGLLGQTMATWGMQRWIALAAGSLMLLLIILPTPAVIKNSVWQRLIARLKSAFASRMQNQNPFQRFILGALNGLLPCGLVYTALAASIAVGSAIQGALFMFTFGIATTPGLLAASGIIAWIKKTLQPRAFRKTQLVMMLIAFLVILRGAQLGIPYLSPQLSAQKTHVDCCHKP